jgi:hypothetical protein
MIHNYMATPTNLFEYYQQKNQALPSVQERMPIYQQYGGQGTYQGTAEQNTFLLGKLIGSSQTVSTPPVRGSGTYVEDLANNIQSQINEAQNKVSEAKSAGYGEKEQIHYDAQGKTTIKEQKPVVQTSAQARADLESKLYEGKTTPTPYKSVDEFKKLREEQGITKDEEELASIRNEAALNKEEMRRFSATAGEGVSEGGRIGMVSEAERNLNFRQEGLAIREQAVIDRLNSKNAYIKTVIDLEGQDYKTALDDYNNTFDKNYKITTLLNSQANDAQKDAITGLTTLTNLLQDKNIDLSNIDPAVKTQIDTLSLKAGLPVGLIEQIITTSPQDKIQSVASRTDANGNTYFDVLKVAPDGGLYTEKIYRGTGEGGGIGNTKNKQLISAINNQIRNNNLQGADEKVAWESYKDMLLTWINNNGTESEFYINYPVGQWLDQNNQKEFSKWLSSNIKSNITDKNKGINFEDY